MIHWKITKAEVSNKMNRYNFIKDHEDILLQFIRKGIISYQIIRDTEIYEAFKAMKFPKNRQDKYIELANEFELSPARIEQICYSMSK